MSTPLYEKDFYQWLEHTADLVREGRLDEIDREVLIDELESMGKRDKRELANRLIILMAHLLKWKHQPEARSSGWVGSIAEQRLQIAGQLEDSPSLRTILADAAEKAYPKAIALAARETDMPPDRFPAVCPFSLSQLLDETFFPES
ncbi:conserved hypothetical protein [Thiocapsa sp. KS1]|jgi:hypothetical protein|nr:DUF29 domain-containing protein [Thiocapsa sp. KS1]CRI64521.1 conserved hypothetical protein [Thiocapsa sp. KS1]